ncbi:MAG: hypothetical protein DRQ10_07630, partial [Candidatus Hydrothermota bacterium]
EKAIRKYAGSEWKQKLNSKLPTSKFGAFLRKILKIKQVHIGLLHTLLQKLTVLRCQKSIEEFSGWWKFSTALLKACPQCRTFWKTVKDGMFDFKGADLLVESLSLVIAAWNPLSKILTFLPKLASAFLSLILSFLAIAFLLNAIPLAYKCRISCPQKVKRQQKTAFS